jgi:hypothetical protein
VLDVASAAPAHWERPLLAHRRRRGRVTAKRLQGTIAAGPFGMPIGRAGVLAEPAGATFSVTQINRAR